MTHEPDLPLPSRRDVLSLGLGLAVASCLPRPAAAADDGSFEFTYFTDTHVALERNVAECRAMLAKVHEFSKPVFAVNGGDVTDYGWATEYSNYQRLIRRFGVRTLQTAGNHDVRWSPQGVKIFKERLGPTYQAFQHKGCHVILLDSTVPLSHWGHYEAEQLRWLEETLRDIGRAAPVILTTHHWVGRDDLRVDNEDELMRLIEPYNVKLILNGHGHSDLLWTWNGVAGTMNRGLYQGSWQRVAIDRSADRLTLERYRKEDDRLTLIAEVALKPSPERRPIWKLGAPRVQLGDPIQLIGPLEGAQARLNQGKWSDLEGTAIATTGLIPGEQVVQVRTKDRTWSAPVQVDDPASRIEPMWQQRLTGGVMSHLVVAEETLFVSQMDGAVETRSAADGRRIWRSKLGGYCHSTPLVTESLVIVGAADGTMAAFGRASGRPSWTHRSEGPVYASAAVAQSVVIFGSGDGAFYGLDLASGRQVWRTPMPASDTAFAQSKAATDGRFVFISAWDSHIYAIVAESGEIAWRTPLMPRTFAFSPAISSPAVADGFVYVAANGNGLFCLEAATGRIVWEVAAQGDKYGHSSPVVVGDRLVVGCLGDLGQVRSVRRSDGSEVWTAATGSVIYDSSPAIGAGFCAIGSVANLLNVIDLAEGAVRAQWRLPAGHFLSTPAANGNVVFAATYANRLMAFRVRS